MTDQKLNNNEENNLENILTYKYDIMKTMDQL